MRSAMPPAVLASHGRLTSSPRVRAGLLLAAAGELVGDKLPKTPSRTMPPGVIGRLAGGAICGWVVGGPVGAAVASATAGATTFVGHGVRAAAVKGSRLPDLPFALIEDAIAISVAIAGARLAGERNTP
jgi:uncharacterized membrane protein